MDSLDKFDCIGHHLMDLRSFGAIGFQDAPNGLWCGKQKYNQSELLKLVIDAAIQNRCSTVAITSEDDVMFLRYPEDRFGFLSAQINRLPKNYKAEKISDNFIKAEELEKTVYLVNSETVHASGKDDWAGLKVQVIGKNLLPKNYSLGELLRYCNDEGLPTLLCNTGASNSSSLMAEFYAKEVSAIVTHDANNAFYDYLSIIPFLGSKIKKYTQSSNKKAEILAEKLKVPGVAVSSSHYINQIGRAGIYVSHENINFTNEAQFLKSLQNTLFTFRFKNKIGYNYFEEVAMFRYLIGKHGSSPKRFEGAVSSYNKV